MAACYAGRMFLTVEPGVVCWTVAVGGFGSFSSNCSDKNC